MRATFRFLRQYLRPRPDSVRAVETRYARAGAGMLPATLYLPARRRGALAAWVVLHGLTATGRNHPSLRPFAGALAASGAAVLVPEVPEWIGLRVAPEVTGATIAGAAAALAERREVDPGRIGVMGFSFGATQALVAATDAEVGGGIRAIAAWGGYCDLDALFLFGLTGEHELDGRRYRLDPDPYGRWIMMANYVTRIPGLEGYDELASALHELALESGRKGLIASHAVYDPLRRELGAKLPRDQRRIFDMAAPLSGRAPAEMDVARELAPELARAARSADPLLDPSAHLPLVRVTTRIAHGRGDRLVPFTEAFRLQRALPGEICRGCTVTSLYGHSGAEDALGAASRAGEAVRFARLLTDILGLL